MNSFFSILVPPGSPETDCITAKIILENWWQITGLLSYDPLPLNSENTVIISKIILFQGDKTKFVFLK